MIKKLLCILFCTISLAVFTEEDIVEEIITVASKVSQKINKVNFTVDVIDQEELKRQAPTDFISILSNTLGLDTSKNGGPGQYSSIFMRGSNSNHTQVKINGVKINPYTAGGASIHNLDPSLISYIEVGSGPFSSTHGSEAIGGVINISTIRNNKNPFTKITLGLGADNLMKKGLQTYLTGGNKSLNLLVLNSKTNGFPSLKNSLIDNNHENRSFLGSLNFEKSKAEIRLSSWISKGKTEYLDFFGDPLSQKYKTSALSADLDFKFNMDNIISFTLSSSKDLILQNQFNYLNFRDVTETDNRNIEIILSNSLKKNLLLVTGLIQENQNVDYSSFGTTFEKKFKTNSIISEVTKQIEGNKFVFKLRVTNHETYDRQESWNISYKKDLNNFWSIRLSSGTAFRSPNSSELYGFGSNISLKPETSKGQEISIEKIINDTNLSLLIFNNKIKNLINFSYLNSILENIEHSKTNGLEIRYLWKNKQVNGRLLLRYQNPKDHMGEQLLRRSKKSFSLNIYKELSLGTLNLNLSAFDKKKDFGGVILPNYELLNLSLYKQKSKNLSFTIKLENLLDKEYFTASGFNGYYQNQGRSLWLNASYNIVH